VDSKQLFNAGIAAFEHGAFQLRRILGAAQRFHDSGYLRFQLCDFHRHEPAGHAGGVYSEKMA
jgi:hypothetical protein